MKLYLITFVVALAVPAFGQNPLPERPKDKIDLFWQASKATGIAAAIADTKTTIRVIGDGGHENNRIHNLMVSKYDPAPIRRTALLVGSSVLLNAGLDYACKRWPSKKMKWLAIGTRAWFTADHIKCAYRNTKQ